MDDQDPFSQESLDEIFKISPKNPELLSSRECSWLEFKESFGWSSLAKYLRTCASYANTKGGYIVFGIKNQPHTMIGLKGGGLKAFESMDPEKLSNHFNTHFEPEIHWDIHQYELSGKTYGLLYVKEAKDKPVICCKNSADELKEGDIYYRYRGRTERIRYSELRSILDIKRENEQRFWMQHLERIARIGVREAAIFDIHSGQVSGTGGSFLIDESLLSQLSFIKEGEFSEVKGKPTLKLIGSLEPTGNISFPTGKRHIIKTKGIRTADIVLAFLNHESVLEPQEYIKQICFETTSFLPVYYYMNLADLDRDTTIQMLNEVVARSPAKTKLIERLTNNAKQKMTLPSRNTPAANKKRDFTTHLLNRSVDKTLSGKDLEYCLQAIRILSPEKIETHSAYFRDLLRTWFNQHYASAHGTLVDNLRRSICWVDEALYSIKEVTGSTEDLTFQPR